MEKEGFWAEHGDAVLAASVSAIAVTAFIYLFFIRPDQKKREIEDFLNVPDDHW